MLLDAAQIGISKLLIRKKKPSEHNERRSHLSVPKTKVKCWIMNEKVRSSVQTIDIGFLRRISGLTLLDKHTRVVFASF